MPAILRERPPIDCIEFETPFFATSLDAVPSWKQVVVQRQRRDPNHTQQAAWLSHKDDPSSGKQLDRLIPDSKPSWARIVQQPPPDTSRPTNHPVVYKNALTLDVSTMSTTGAETSLFQQESEKAIVELAAQFDALKATQNALYAEHDQRVKHVAKAMSDMRDCLVTQAGEPLEITVEERMAIMTDMLAQLEVSQTAIASNHNAMRSLHDAVLAIQPDRTIDE